MSTVAVAAADQDPNPTVRAIASGCTADPGWPVQARVPFSSARRWSGASFTGHGTWLLGAPGVVSAELPPGVAAAVARHEAEGERVLLLAGTDAPLAGDRVPAGAEPAALLVLTEELREEAEQTISYLARQGVTVKVLSGDAPRAAATLGSYALARALDGVSPEAARTAAMLALLAVSLWVLGIAAGRATWRLALVPAMAAFLVPLLAIPQARATFAVQLPPAGVLLQVAGIALGAIAGLTVWRRLRQAG